MVTGVSTFQRVTCAAVLLLSIGVGGPGAASRRHVRWADVLEQPASWYATAEAHAVADAVLLYQRASGGWPKDLDMTAPPPDPSSLPAEATIDNRATTTQVRLLALVGERGGPEREATDRRGIPGLEGARHAPPARVRHSG